MTEPKSKETVSEFSKPEPKAPPTQPPPQTVACFVIPVAQMDGLRDALKAAPYREANGALQWIDTLQVMQVPVQRPDLQ